MDAEAVRAAYRRWAGRLRRGVRRHLPAGAPPRGGAGEPPPRRARCWRSASAPASPCRTTGADKRVTGIDLSAEMLARARKRVADRELANVDGAARDGRRGDRSSRTPRSTSRWRCSWPRWCRIRAGCWRRCGAWCGRAATSCSSTISPPRTGRAGGSSARMAPASRALGWHPDFAAGGAVRARGPRRDRDRAGAAVRHLHAGAAGELRRRRRRFGAVIPAAALDLTHGLR